MGRTGWDAKFPEPIPLADGSKLATLRDAIAHLGKIIPKPNMTSGGKPPQTGPAYASKHWSTAGNIPTQCLKRSNWSMLRVAAVPGQRCDAMPPAASLGTTFALNGRTVT